MDWFTAKKISECDDVAAALSGFSQDSTEDNAVILVQEIAKAFSKHKEGRENQ